MRRSQWNISSRYQSLARKPGTSTTGAPAPRGTPVPQYTAEKRREIQSIGASASSQIGTGAGSSSVRKYGRAVDMGDHTDCCTGVAARQRDRDEAIAKGRAPR